MGGLPRVGAGTRMAFKVQRYACVLVLNSLCFAWQVWLHQGVALRWGIRSYALCSQGPCSNVANEGLFSCVADANLLQSDAVGAQRILGIRLDAPPRLWRDKPCVVHCRSAVNCLKHEHVQRLRGTNTNSIIGHDLLLQAFQSTVVPCSH